MVRFLPGNWSCNEARHLYPVTTYERQSQEDTTKPHFWRLKSCCNHDPPTKIKEFWRNVMKGVLEVKVVEAWRSFWIDIGWVIWRAGNLGEMYGTDWSKRYVYVNTMYIYVYTYIYMFVCVYIFSNASSVHIFKVKGRKKKGWCGILKMLCSGHK